jgi:hypothetical protein
MPWTGFVYSVKYYYENRVASQAGLPTMAQWAALMSRAQTGPYTTSLLGFGASGGGVMQSGPAHFGVGRYGIALVSLVLTVPVPAVQAVRIRFRTTITPRNLARLCPRYSAGFHLLPSFAGGAKNKYAEFNWRPNYAGMRVRLFDPFYLGPPLLPIEGSYNGYYSAGNATAFGYGKDVKWPGATVPELQPYRPKRN